MGRQASAESGSRFLAFVEGLASVIGHADREKPLRDYCMGLVMPCERKSVEPMAAVTAPARVGAQHQSLLHFFGEAPWSDEDVLVKVREMVLPAVERHGAIEAQVVALEKAKAEKETHGEFESEHPGYCGAQDTFYVGNMKGVGRIYQQTFIDTYTKVAFAKLYDRKTPITAADLLNDRVLPFFEQHEVKLLRVLTDRGSEYCGNPERHEYELYLAVEDIDHSRTKTKSPQTNGICERFHKTALNEFYRVAFRKKVYRSLDELQADLDAWLADYNESRPHQGRWCFGKTPMQTFLDAMPMTKEKMIAA